MATRFSRGTVLQWVGRGNTSSRRQGPHAWSRASLSGRSQDRNLIDLSVVVFGLRWVVVLTVVGEIEPSRRAVRPGCEHEVRKAHGRRPVGTDRTGIDNADDRAAECGFEDRALLTAHDKESLPSRVVEHAFGLRVAELRSRGGERRHYVILGSEAVVWAALDFENAVGV